MVMKSFTTKLKRKYTRRLFAAALDMAVRTATSSSRPYRHRVALGIQLCLLRLWSWALGMEKEFMQLFTLTKDSLQRAKGCC